MPARSAATAYGPSAALALAMRRASSCPASPLPLSVQAVCHRAVPFVASLSFAPGSFCFLSKKGRRRQTLRLDLLVSIRKTGTMASETTTPALEALVIALHDIGAVKVPDPPPPLCGRAGCGAPILGCVCMPARNRATRHRALRASRLPSAAHAPSWTHVSVATI